MRKHRRSIWTNAPLSAAAAVFCGLTVTAASWLLLSAVLFFVMRDMNLVKAFAGASCVFGGYAELIYTADTAAAEGLSADLYAELSCTEL